MLTTHERPRKSGRMTKRMLANEAYRLRLYLESAIGLILEITDFVDLGDVPEDPHAPEEWVEVPFGAMTDLRSSAQFYAGAIGYQQEE